MNDIDGNLEEALMIWLVCEDVTVEGMKAELVEVVVESR